MQQVTPKRVEGKNERTPRALVIDDEFLIAQDAAETMSEMGFARIGRALSYDEAVAEIDRDPPAVALIDLHLGGDGAGERLMPLLTRHGCACLFFSGDEVALERIGERFPQWPALRKPAPKSALEQAIRQLVAREPTGLP